METTLLSSTIENSSDNFSINDSQQTDANHVYSIFLFDTNGRLLVQQRGKDIDTTPLGFTNTLSGTKDDDNNDSKFKESIIKELKSTFNIELDASKVKYCDKISYVSSSGSLWAKNNINHIYFSQTDIDPQSLKLDKDLVYSYRLCNQDDLNNMLKSDESLLTLWFRKMLQLYNPLYDTLKELSLNPSSSTKQVGNLLASDGLEDTDYALLTPYSYIMSKSGKGVRLKVTDVLGKFLNVSKKDMESIKYIIESGHNGSLLIDDIQDRSLTRRGIKCGHLIYGTALTINAPYLMSYKVLNNIPQLFRKNHYETLQVMIDESVAIHRGQGTDIYWSDINYCPSEEEYINMIKGKTGSPFRTIGKLCLLHRDISFIERIILFIRYLFATFMRYLFNIKIEYDYKNKIIDILEEIGIFFQVRDDYINLTDKEYWKEKGVCDDLREKKFSFPVIYCLQNKLGRYQELIDLYKKDQLDNKDVLYALDIIKETNTLEYTKNYLDKIKNKIYHYIDRYPVLLVLQKYVDQLKY